MTTPITATSPTSHEISSAELSELLAPIENKDAIGDSFDAPGSQKKAVSLDPLPAKNVGSKPKGYVKSSISKVRRGTSEQLAKHNWGPRLAGFAGNAASGYLGYMAIQGTLAAISVGTIPWTGVAYLVGLTALSVGFFLGSRETLKDGEVGTVGQLDKSSQTARSIAGVTSGLALAHILPFTLFFNAPSAAALPAMIGVGLGRLGITGLGFGIGELLSGNSVEPATV